jgi:Zn-dependent peptidase ImmA (M78 family)
VSDRVAVKPELLRWACDRARLEVEVLAVRFPKLPEWIAGDVQPTLKQLEQFAKATHAPFGFLLLSKPPAEQVPIPDFRTIAGRPVARPSPDLLDTIYQCQERQDWYRDFARSIGEEAREFVGSVSAGADVVATAAAMRRTLAFDLDQRRKASTWAEALRTFIENAETAGVLVMVNGVVGSNTSRKLDPEEFRGFALADPLAPLVFVNGADTKSAQMFTLAHELVHLWAGETALTDSDPSRQPKQDTERWCNEVAAELLVPLAVFKAELRRSASLRAELDRLAKVFKVSTLVILRRMHDVGALRGEAYQHEYRQELARLLAVQKGSGGNFYLTQAVRNSRRFSRALIADTLEGNTLYREAFHMLGIKRDATFREMSAQLGYTA